MYGVGGGREGGWEEEKFCESWEFRAARQAASLCIVVILMLRECTESETVIPLLLVVLKFWSVEHWNKSTDSFKTKESYNTFDVRILQHSVSQSVQKSVEVLLHSPDSGALSCIFKAGSRICFFPVSSLDSLKEIRTECEKSFSTEYCSDYKAGSALVRVNLFLEKKDTWSAI